jgi:hypothetical protein
MAVGVAAISGRKIIESLALIGVDVNTKTESDAASW